MNMQSVPIYQTWPGARPAARPAAFWFLALTGAVMTIGTVVLIEPAPIDLAIMGVLAAGLALGQLAFVRKHELPMIFMAGFVFANLLSTVFAVDESRALYFVSITAYMLAWFILFAGLPTRHGYGAVTVIMNGYVIAGVFSAVLGTLSYLRVIGHQETLLLYNRPKGLFKDPNVYGPYMVPVLMWALVQLQERGRSGLGTLYWAGVSVIAAGGIFWSFSRACWINTVVTLFSFFTIRLISGTLTKRALANAVKLLFSVLLLAILGLVFTERADRQLDAMLTDRLGSHGLKQYDTERFYTQRLAWEAVREKPLGIGPGQAEPVFHYSTHSLYLRTLSENGFFGFVTFMALLALTLVRAVNMAASAADERWRTYFTVLGACIAGLLVNSLVIDTLHWRHFFMLLGLVWASHPSMYRRKEQA